MSAYLTEAHAAALVAHCEASSDPVAKQVAATITGTPAGAQAVLGDGSLLKRLGPVWDKVGPLLVQLLLAELAKKATPSA